MPPTLNYKPLEAISPLRVEQVETENLLSERLLSTMVSCPTIPEHRTPQAPNESEYLLFNNSRTMTSS